MTQTDKNGRDLVRGHDQVFAEGRVKPGVEYAGR
jgi:hypothetical protein